MTAFRRGLRVALPGAILLLAPLTSSAQETRPKQAGYAQPHLLVDTAWLAEHVGDEKVRVLDVRDPDAYAKGHIPGALNLPRNATFDPAGPSGIVGKLPQIEELLGSRGVDETVHVILYDPGFSTAAARVFWTLEHYGHPRVSVLDGGLTRWKADGREISTDSPVVQPVRSKLSGTRSKLSTRKSMLAALETSGSCVSLDARSLQEHTGERVTARRSGRIPGSVHIEWTRNFASREMPVYKSAAALRQLYETAGVTKDKKIHAY